MNDGRSQDSWDEVLRTAKHFNESKTERLAILFTMFGRFTRFRTTLSLSVYSSSSVQQRRTRIKSINDPDKFPASSLLSAASWTRVNCRCTRPEEGCTGTARPRGMRTQSIIMCSSAESQIHFLYTLDCTVS